jgi:hypothetical protein
VSELSILSGEYPVLIEKVVVVHFGLGDVTPIVIPQNKSDQVELEKFPSWAGKGVVPLAARGLSSDDLAPWH